MVWNVTFSPTEIHQMCEIGDAGLFPGCQQSFPLHPKIPEPFQGQPLPLEGFENVKCGHLGPVKEFPEPEAQIPEDENPCRPFFLPLSSNPSFFRT